MKLEIGLAGPVSDSFGLYRFGDPLRKRGQGGSRRDQNVDYYFVIGVRATG